MLRLSSPSSELRPKRGLGFQRLEKPLHRVIREAQDDFTCESLLLDGAEIEELAEILVDFAEDVHCEVGLWEAYERFNREFFQTPLPMIAAEEVDRGSAGLSRARIQHLLWVLYPELVPGLILAPGHADLLHLAEAVRAFLDRELRSAPRESSTKTFLQAPNEYGWDVKRKLIWLGTESYLFRLFYRAYLEKEGDPKNTITHTDDFVCQQCTHWSGLGAIDILAYALDLTENDRRDLRSWYERHASFYEMRSVSNEVLDARNVISGDMYRVRINMDRHPFERGQVFFGSLVPWRGEWYWSGMQRSYGPAANINLDDLRKTMRRTSPGIVCRFWKEYEAQVRERAKKLHEELLAYSGRDLVVYTDGLAMAADWQKEIRAQWESRPAEEREKVMQRHGLGKGPPSVRIPPDLLENKSGIGVFLNPDEGKEIVQDFNSLLSGLRRKGEGLSDDEADVIRRFFQFSAVSPRFAQRLIQDHGTESIRAAFLVRDDAPGYWLDYLLRAHKGEYYRKRYPSVAVV
ncbi:MAG TPA: DUF3843 family protein [Phycisphaerae bacterium]|nr:DUF3843 family protein [Phycisphaerae bacterium]